MTTPQLALGSRGLRHASLPDWAPAGAVAAATAVTVLLFAVTPMQGVADFVVVAVLLSVATIAAASWSVEGRRRAVDRVATTGALVALVLTLIPLGFVLGYVVKQGLKVFGWAFLTHSAGGSTPISAGGGVGHAILGSLEQVMLASLIAVPLGLLVAIYITEFGRNWLGTAVRFLVDVMIGIPSIVAGLFVLAFWVIVLNQPFTGFAGALALSILELPIVVRTSEEMLRLVPGSLREASYALGVPRWKTVLRIVVPTASTGITTGVMLAIARVLGETAPVLLVVGGNAFTNTDPFTGSQGSLPLFIFQNAQSSSVFDVQRAWGAAMTLILIVMILYVAARILTRRNTLAQR